MELHLHQFDVDDKLCGADSFRVDEDERFTLETVLHRNARSIVVIVEPEEERKHG